jgi:hypothetical protein
MLALSKEKRDNSFINNSSCCFDRMKLFYGLNNEGVT